MPIIKISIHGCDDSTIFDIEANENEIEFLEKIAEKSVEVSKYNCMPTMEIERSNKK